MRQASRHILTLVAVLGLAAAGCGGDDNGGPTGPGGGGGASDVTITIPSGSFNAGAMAFSPNPATVKVGQTVSWKNNDNLQHTATQVGGGFNVVVSAGATSSPLAISGATGDRDYQCTVGGHTMSGTLSVVP